VCLPEQLLCTWHGRSPARIIPSAVGRSEGMCAPQRRSPSPSPSSASQAATRSVCITAPPCEAQASASRSLDSPAPAPDSRSGSAWIILEDERG